MDKQEIKDTLLEMAKTIREDADKDERDNAEPMGVPCGPGKSPPAKSKKKVVKESALEVPDIHIDAHSDYHVVGGEQVKGKVIKYVRFGNFLAPISVVVEEEMWKDADGSIFKFAGQAAAQQAIHALLSGGGSHVAAPKLEDGGEQGGESSALPSAGSAS